ncbi:hypothetical protein [Neolewinella persica]|uniref:hypothetical protein n=1 Tax=Neolewinella persica TaxID=70998 RepID=UPI0005C78D9C|nr:hypothetical protein [Neolewinella persica]
MKQIFLFTSCLLLSFTCVAERFFVTPNGASNASGKSWAEATNIQVALDRATASDEIWTKRGTYQLNAAKGRAATFVIRPGVKLYGGFLGTEVDLSQRQAGVFSTFSGEMGDPTANADNAFTVVTMESSMNHNSTLDGFLITGGTSRNFKEGLTSGSSGGGLYIKAGSTPSNHLIVNCIFTENRAHNGGAVLVDSGRPSFINCKFNRNAADFNGGAVYNKGMASVASPIFRDCIFEDNSSNSGAGMTNNGSNGSASPLLIGCDFINNTSLMNGAAIYNIKNDNGETEPVLENCSFVGNDSILGDDVSGNGVTRTIADKARQNGGGNLRPTVRR